MAKESRESVSFSEKVDVISYALSWYLVIITAWLGYHLKA